MNPGVSLHVTGALPILRVTSRRASYVESDVFDVRMISTSFIAVHMSMHRTVDEPGTGLKKCKPAKLQSSVDTTSSRTITDLACRCSLHDCEISVIDREEVLVAKMQSGLIHIVNHFKYHSIKSCTWPWYPNVRRGHA
jgi:hypothetical protein